MASSDIDTPSIPVPAAPVLELEGIQKRYAGAEKPALHSLSLTLKAGEILGLLGPNGAGKTTTISIIAGLIRADAGSMKLPQQANTNKFQDSVALVPQDIAVFQKLTAKENLEYFGRLYGIPRKELHPRIENSLKMMQLTEHRTKWVAQLSGGLKRRVNIAVGLLNNPSVLLLDEPMVGVDAQTKLMIANELRSCANRGTGILYTSHNMDEIQQLCHRVCIVDGGKVICEGTPEQLLMDHANCKNLEELFIQLTGHALRD